MSEPGSFIELFFAGSEKNVSSSMEKIYQSPVMISYSVFVLFKIHFDPLELFPMIFLPVLLKIWAALGKLFSSRGSNLSVARIY